MLKTILCLILGQVTPGEKQYAQGSLDFIIATAPPCEETKDGSITTGGKRSCIAIFTMKVGTEFKSDPIVVRKKR